MAWQYDSRSYGMGFHKGLEKGKNEADDSHLHSIAISLKRIADMMESGKMVDAMQQIATQAYRINDSIDEMNHK